jgi:epoxyqueuosine reductase
VGHHGPVGSLHDRVIARGRVSGLDAVGIAGAEPFTEARRALQDRRSRGLHGGMAFTYRNPERSTDPSRTLAGARSLVVGALRHSSTWDEMDPDPGAVSDPAAGRPLARVARYATGDHYDRLRRALRAVALELTTAGHRAVVLADDNSLVDRAAAHRAGLGWFGKSSNLLLPGRGSWFVLGSVLTDAELEPARAPVADGCGTCRRCRDACPTGAIVADGVLDAGRCLSWHLQVGGDFPREFRVALGDRIYGCDDCQEVCPPNRRADARGEGTAVAVGTGGPGPRVDVLWMLAADDDELLAGVGRWYVPGRDPRHLRRNALVVLGNTADGADPAVRAALERHLTGDDDLLCGHAAWAALRLGLTGLLDAPGVSDRSVVRAERAAGVPTRA